MSQKLKYVGWVFAGIAVGAFGVQALHAQEGTTRTELRRIDVSGASGLEAIMATLELQPGAKVPRHFHHGDELLYVLEGGSFQAPGQDPVTLPAGASLQFLREVPHGGFAIVGDKPLKVLTVHIVDKGKPPAVLVK